ncbi:MAG: DUF3194 domain-containing protein [Candidatus Methanomethylicaceae archaeon]
MKTRSPEQIKEICEAGETAALQFILSKLDKKLIKSMDIRVCSEKKASTTFKVDVALELEAGVEVDADKLAEMAAEEALSAIDRKMRER